MTDQSRFEMTDREFNQIRDIVYKEIGVSLSASKRSLVVSRLSKRLRELGFRSFSAYVGYLSESDVELDILFNYITTNVTRFFRENHHFDFLTAEYLPGWEQEVRAKGLPKVVRIWSAGCSTGEEPYSLAMVLHDYFQSKKGWDIRILASDINTETLNKARKGLFTTEEVEGVPRPMLTRYFQKGVGPNLGWFKVKDELRKLVHFKRINLTAEEDYPIGDELNFTFCRNVFIYFDKDTQQDVLRRFARHVRKDGFLFLGHSESINCQEVQEWKLIRHTIYERMA